MDDEQSGAWTGGCDDSVDDLEWMVDARKIDQTWDGMGWDGERKKERRMDGRRNETTTTTTTMDETESESSQRQQRHLTALSHRSERHHTTVAVPKPKGAI